MSDCNKYNKVTESKEVDRNVNYVLTVITGRNKVLAKVIFLHLSVIHSVHRGEYLTRHPRDQTPPRTRHPPRPDTPPDQAGTPWDQTPPWDQTTPPGTRHPPPARRSRHRNTVNDRPVRILLECILVQEKISIMNDFIRFYTKLLSSLFLLGSG